MGPTCTIQDSPHLKTLPLTPSLKFLMWCEVTQPQFAGTRVCTSFRSLVLPTTPPQDIVTARQRHTCSLGLDQEAGGAQESQGHQQPSRLGLEATEKLPNMARTAGNGITKSRCVLSPLNTLK